MTRSLGPAERAVTDFEAKCPSAKTWQTGCVTFMGVQSGSVGNTDLSDREIVEIGVNLMAARAANAAHQLPWIGNRLLQYFSPVPRVLAKREMIVRLARAR